MGRATVGMVLVEGAVGVLWGRLWGCCGWNEGERDGRGDEMRGRRGGSGGGRGRRTWVKYEACQAEGTRIVEVGGEARHR